VSVQVLHGDARCLPLPDESIDAIVTDPPYELGFMGKRWDSTGVAYDSATWREALRVLKPGGHLLAFGGTRTYHRLACAIEDAGFEVRDSITWLYGSGFPKSLDVSKAIDKAAGAVRQVVGSKLTGTMAGQSGALNAANGWRGGQEMVPVTAPATPDAERWQGWGTALKPASEPIIVARKPFAGTVAANVLEHGTGGINVDGCRVGTGGQLRWAQPRDMGYHGGTDAGSVEALANAVGRWPANVVLSHAPTCIDVCADGCPVAELDGQSGVSASLVRPPSANSPTGNGHTHGVMAGIETLRGHNDTGGASRFFPTFRYQAKAPTSERPKVDGVAHPCVKPLALMRWLVRLVTPAGGVVLDPFAGSGTTGEAAQLEGFDAILVERDKTYLPLIAARVERSA
jgi:hypothetical protein